MNTSQFSIFFRRLLRLPFILHHEVFQDPEHPKATFVFIHGIGNALRSWDDVVKDMPADVRLIGIDLLGFGTSPKPTWAVYNATTQARSVAATLLHLKLSQSPILVGHSLGALVAIKIARRYPLVIKELVLCSPPLYQPEMSGQSGVKPPEALLRGVYRFARKHPEQFEKLSHLAVRVGLANRTLDVSKDTIGSYMAALESSIINQTSLKDIQKLWLPITIFYGALDPVVVAKHITNLAATRRSITAKKLIAGHEVVGGYARAVAAFLKTRV